MMNNAESFNGDNISSSAKDLYAQACQHNEKGERDKVYEISTILIKKYPESKEAKWAIRNFSPFWSSGEKKVINIQSISLLAEAFYMRLDSLSQFTILSDSLRLQKAEH